MVQNAYLLANREYNSKLFFHTVVTVGFRPTSYSEEEGQAIVFTVEILEGQAQASILVNFITGDVSATGKQLIINMCSVYCIIYHALASIDYTSTSQILSFSPGTTRLTVSVPTINDGVFEGDEVFEAILSLPEVGSARVNLRDERAAAVIEDNDGEELPNYSSMLLTIHIM